ncbi:hypothetical protein BC829DRAFT_231374 [Chytridium lagenaria]|nr:hypothetical protein BC829DRAFT_231374 [Chytridium lagenaria]
MGKTAPILSRAYDHIQTDITIKSAGRPSVVKTLNVESKEDSIPNYMNRKVAGRNSLAKSYHVTLKDESLPGYGIRLQARTHQTIKMQFDFRQGRRYLYRLFPNFFSTRLTPMSDETRFAFTNLANNSENTVPAYPASSSPSSSPPSPPNPHGRMSRSPNGSNARHSCIITMTVSFFIDAVVLWVERRVDEDGLREAVEEFRMARVSWLVYLEMVMHVLGVCGAFVMAMPGVLQNGDGCFKGGRKGWG